MLAHHLGPTPGNFSNSPLNSLNTLATSYGPASDIFASLTSGTSNYLLESKRHTDPAKTKPPGRDCGNSPVDIVSTAEVIPVRHAVIHVAAYSKKGFWLIYCSLLR